MENETINKKNLVDYVDFIADKPDLKNYKEITNYPRKTYFSKLKYKFPSLVKTGFNKFSMNLNLEIQTPIIEENQRNKNLFSIRSVYIDKEKINKGFERKLPSFCPKRGNKYLIEQEKNKKKEIKLLKRSYEKYFKKKKESGGSTTEKFFKGISRNLLQNKFYVRNMNNKTESIDKSDLFITKNQTINNEISNNYSLNVNDNKIEKSNKNEKKGIKDNKSKKYRGRNMRNYNSLDYQFDKNYLDIIRTEKIIKSILTSNY